MQTLDFIVLGGYFILMIGIGILCSLKIKKQEDFFMGGRGFGKLMQTFAAFGAGTGAQDPINVGRTVWTSGLSGVWSALLWLFVTPFYWITAVWYRRMRHLTLGDWFVERYESKPMGAAYTLFAFAFQISYLSIMFSAISKVAKPLLGEESVLWLVSLIQSDNPDDLKFVLVPLIGVVVIAYGILGGLAAAYWTDLIQGICIIVLSVILIPYGLSAVVDKYGDQYVVQETQQPVTEAADGLSILHERVTDDYFQLAGGPRSSEFPLHYIISLTLLALVGIVVQPHFIVTGGGSAKSEFSARMGLVSGNFLKRLCTIGWALTALIVLALLASDQSAASDPDEVWGIASREILGPLNLGLVGLMLACLLAAMMSSADCYMLVSSALVVRNLYAPFINSKASEKHYVTVGRITGMWIIIASGVFAIYFYDVFEQYKFALNVSIVFAAPFWIGMYWRRATAWAAWGTYIFSVAVFFVAPVVLPMAMEDLKSDQQFAIATNTVITETTREATLADVEKRDAEIAVWQAKKEEDEEVGDPPEKLVKGQEFVDRFTAGGKSILWSGALKPVGEVKTETVGKPVERTNASGDKVVVTTQRKVGKFEGDGRFNLDFLIYHYAGMDLRQQDQAMLETLRLIPRIVIPFLVMILLSLITPRNSKDGLDRFYVKMKTPVNPDPALDAEELDNSYKLPNRFDHKRLFPFMGLEIQKPTFLDVFGFIASVGICFVFLAILYWLAGLGSF